MRRVLVALCLIVLSCTILEAKPASKGRRVSPGVARPESGTPQLSARERLWKRLFGTTTMDDPAPPPPPAPRDYGPVP
ncbi:MAG TPA: hypothetical protein VGS98_14855 [Thermoanaerobaculia bacterium]|nr:hypothetical protein [Thermoanaerobaculia bacterium]